MMIASNLRQWGGVFLTLALSLGSEASQGFPPLKKGGEGGFFSEGLPTSTEQKSPSIPLFQREKTIAKAHSVCVGLIAEAHNQRRLVVALGSTMRVRFRHSIYGSQVEEYFAVRQHGFELAELRYGEARLVEFYGYEQGRFENGNWLVKPAPLLFPRLDLRASQDAALSVDFDPPQKTQPIVVRPNSTLRLSVERCASRADG
jgi:hypothetical protein